MQKPQNTQHFTMKSCDLTDHQQHHTARPAPKTFFATPDLHATGRNCKVNFESAGFIDESPCFTTLCLASPCSPCSPCFTLLCHALPCFAVLCRALPCFAVLCRALPCHAVSCRVMPCHAVSCRVMPCHAVCFFQEIVKPLTVS
jgi:hypothetical protein